ncbi:putative lipid II flippase FtsW [Coxiella endosymbiont of Ornithodoros amblus]|uniref:putative lipid II flippase FtsW n=1 Tax=Coxiella endosymbiont of Ornithodoros amblus TaxID=1656166 RepID=UPI00244DEDCC|nr:putative lipid II flippase FtsW [Coxiella endosymbiont of Ornithodoros amblus]MBW5802363.1 putative lipid II flippase FtsW [Coxiella endosymbiont of Ornithodoros amblus]
MRKKSTIFWSYDAWIVICTLSLLGLGLLMVASASMVISDRQFGYPFHYFIRHLIYLSLGLALAWVASRFPIKVWKTYSGYLFLVGFLLLILILAPVIGKTVNGSRRWIQLWFVSLQVSEVVKFITILYLASFLQRYQSEVQKELKGFLKPMLLVGILSGLLLLEPDFGAAVVITMTCLGLLFLAGVRLWPFCVLLILVAGSLILLAILSPYRLQRLTSFLNPWAHQFGSGYQLTQSLIAFGRGGLFGVGLGNSVQKLFYLPEAHTDFLFAVLSEELGLIGEILLMSLFVLLIGRIILIGRRAENSNQLYSAYLAYGIALWLGLQVIINISITAGVLPTKGLTLPFISYGGSSLLMNCLAIGVILRISYETEN